VVQRRIDRRQVHAPQVAASVALEALEYYPAGEPVCHSGLDYGRWTQVRNEAPEGLGLRPVAVVPPTVSGQADP
jgi:hypothetical protein